MLKPEEIMIPEFSKGFKGYVPQEVDNCINMLISEYRELYFKYVETEEKLLAVAEKYKQTSVRATEAMNGVKTMSEAIITDAQTQAEEILTEARLKASKATETMKKSCSEILASYVAAFEEEKQKFILLEEKSNVFKEELLEAYKNHVSDIQNQISSISSEEVNNINFESEVAISFKAGLREDPAMDAPADI